MARQIQVYTPQMQVPVLQAPDIPRQDVSSGLMSVADVERQIEDNFHRQRRETELNDAEIGMATGFSKLKETLRTTDWRQKKDVFTQGAAELKQQYLAGIRDPEVKRAVEATYARMALAHGEAASNAAFEGERDHNIAQTSDALDMFAKDAAAAKTKEERAVAIENGLKAIGTLADGGFVDEARAQALGAKFKESADLFTAEKLVSDSPYVARKLFGDQAAAQARFPSLDPRAMLRLHDSADREVRQRESEAKAAAAAARAENFQDASDLVASDLRSRIETGKGVTDPNALKTIRAGLTDKQWEKYQAAATKADAVFKVTGDMRSMTPAEMAATVDKAKPVAGAADYATQAEAHAEAQKLMAKVLAERKADPARSAAQAFPGVAQAWDQSTSNPEDPGHLRVAIKKTLAAQTAMGIPADQQKALPATMAQAIAGDIRSAPADKAAKKLEGYQAQLGANWSKVYSQLAPNLDAHTAVAATLPANLSAILLETARTADKAGKPGGGVDDLRKALGVQASGTNSVAQLIADDSDFQAFRTAMARKGRGGTVGVTWAQGTEALALGLMARNGDSMTTAADAAIKATIRDKYNFGYVNNVPFVTPKAVDADTAERGARRAQATLKADGLDLPAAGPGALTKDTSAAYLSAVQRNGYWVTTTGNRGLELWAGDVPVTRYGQRIVLTWEQLEARATSDPSEAVRLNPEGKVR